MDHFSNAPPAGGGGRPRLQANPPVGLWSFFVVISLSTLRHLFCPGGAGGSACEGAAFQPLPADPLVGLFRLPLSEEHFLKKRTHRPSSFRKQLIPLHFVCPQAVELAYRRRS
jgi:hypothetical protein